MHIDYHERNAREFVPRRRSIQYMQLIVRVLIKNSYSYASFLSEPISCSKQFFNDWAVNRPGYFSLGVGNRSVHVFYCSRSKTNIASAGVEPGLTFQLVRYGAGFPFQRTRVQTPAKPIFVSVTHAMHDVPHHIHTGTTTQTRTRKISFSIFGAIEPFRFALFIRARSRNLSEIRRNWN